jgi:hypothetical protein
MMIRDKISWTLAVLLPVYRIFGGGEKIFESGAFVFSPTAQGVYSESVHTQGCIPRARAKFSTSNFSGSVLLENRRDF